MNWFDSDLHAKLILIEVQIVWIASCVLFVKRLHDGLGAETSAGVGEDGNRTEDAMEN